MRRMTTMVIALLAGLLIVGTHAQPAAAYGPIGNQTGSGEFIGNAGGTCVAYWSEAESPQQTATNPTTHVSSITLSISVLCSNNNYTDIFVMIDNPTPYNPACTTIAWDGATAKCTLVSNPSPGEYGAQFEAGVNSANENIYYAAGSLQTLVV